MIKQKAAGSSPFPESGYALPISVGMGLIIVLIGFTLILRSSEDRITVTTQQQTANSLAIAEGGIARTLALLNDNYQPFLKLNNDPINPATSRTYLGNDGISNSGDEELTAPTPNWSSPPDPPPCFNSTTLSNELLQGTIGTSSSDQGDYTLLAYRYNSVDNTGTFLMKGEDPLKAGASFIQQTLKIEETISSNPANFPGLMASSINLGNNDVLGAVSGNVVCTNSNNCNIPDTGSNCNNGEPTNSALLTAINAGPNGVVQGRIFIRTVTLPTLPTAPTPTFDPTTEEDLGSITTTRTLTPPSGSTPYSYLVADMTLSGSQSLTVDTSSRPVHIFVSGNIDLSGTASIIHTGEPENLRIYGNPLDGDDSNDQNIVLNGGSSSSNLFLYAPDANAGINGGSSTPDIYGSIWVKTWGNVGSSSNNVEISVPDDMPQRLGGGFESFVVGTQTTTSQRWERVKAP